MKDSPLPDELINFAFVSGRQSSILFTVQILALLDLIIDSLRGEEREEVARTLLMGVLTEDSDIAMTLNKFAPGDTTFYEYYNDEADISVFGFFSSEEKFRQAVRYANVELGVREYLRGIGNEAD